MKLTVRLVILALILLPVSGIFTNCQTGDYTTFREAIAPYIEMYGQPTVSDRYLDKELKVNCEMRQWDTIGVQIIFMKVSPGGKLKTTNGWFVYGIFRKCPNCGRYHIPLPII